MVLPKPDKLTLAQRLKPNKTDAGRLEPALEVCQNCTENLYKALLKCEVGSPRNCTATKLSPHPGRTCRPIPGRREKHPSSTHEKENNQCCSSPESCAPICGVSKCVDCLGITNDKHPHELILLCLFCFISWKMKRLVL